LSLDSASSAWTLGNPVRNTAADLSRKLLRI
jgi:hypothetical protein